MFKISRRLKISKLISVKKIILTSKNNLFSQKANSETTNDAIKIHKKNKGKTEKHIYIMKDKYSVKPEKEIRIAKEKRGEKEVYSKEITDYQKVNFFHTSDVKNKLKKSLSFVFLPRDYPNSVKEGYYEFSKYSFWGGVCIYIMNFLTSQAMIHALGMIVSRPAALTLSTGMNWVLKDGIGQLGAILFAGKYSNSIERDLKLWRWKGSWMLNLGILCEVLTLYKPEYFLFIASAATLLKLSSFVANNSTRTGINYHFCKENNITDLSNKFIAQSNLAFIFGNAVGICASCYIEITFSVIFPLVCLLSVFHLAYSYLSLNVLCLSDFNFQRAYYVGKEFIETGHILTPAIINKKEKFFSYSLKYFYFCNYPIENLTQSERNTKYLNQTIEIFQDSKFFTYVEKNFSTVKRQYIYKIYTFMRLDAENSDIFLAFLYSIKMYHLLQNDEFKSGEKKTISLLLIEKIKDNLYWVNNIDKKDLLKNLKEKGWSSSFSLLEEKYIRYHLLFN